MSELLMFNAKTLEQRYINSYNTHEVETLKSEGWVQNPTLAHMHNPHLNKDINIPIQDVKLWIDKGYYLNPTMIYHPKEVTKKVSEEDAKRAFKNGWYASPAFFPGNDIGEIHTPNVMKEAS